MVSDEDFDTAIENQLKRLDLSSNDILELVIAYRLNKCSDYTFEQALSGVKLKNK